MEKFSGEPFPIIVTRVEDVRNIFYDVKMTPISKDFITTMKKRFKDIHDTWQDPQNMEDAKVEVGKITSHLLGDKIYII